MLDLLLRIFVRKKKLEEEKEKPKDFLLLREEEIEKYVKSLAEREETKILKEAGDFVLKISEKLRDLEKSLAGLEQESISLPDKQIEKVVNSKKQEFIDKMARAIEKVKSVNASNLEIFSQTYYDALHALRETNATALKDFIAIKEYFSISKEVLEKFKDLFDNFFSFQDRLKGDIFIEVNELKKYLYDFTWIKSEIYSKRKEEEEIGKMIEEKKREIEERKKELANLENSEEMKRLLELQKEKMKISYKEKELASICVERVSRVEHILKKVRRQLEISGIKESKVLAELISSPFDATINADVQKILEDVLDYMKKSSFSQEEISKIESLVDEKFFSMLRIEYEELEKRLHEIENEIERMGVVSKKLKIENEIKSTEFEINELEKKEKVIKERIFELESLLPKLKESLENKISKISGKEVKILS